MIEEHLEVLKKGVTYWNRWRVKNLEVMPDLSGITLRDTDYSGINFRNVDLSNTEIEDVDLQKSNLCDTKLDNSKFVRSNLNYALLENAKVNNAYIINTQLQATVLRGATLKSTQFWESGIVGSDFTDADLSQANLLGAYLSGTIFKRSNLSYAIFQGANMIQADFSDANIEGANLSWTRIDNTNFFHSNLNRVNLTRAQMIESNFENASLNDCRIYGIAAWGLKLGTTSQSNLVITQDDEPKITVDNLELAQFIYLFLHSDKIHDTVDAITAKIVLILGRFTRERKYILEAIREELRNHNYVPILFDFEGPESRDRAETIGMLAHISKFIIADITDARSIPAELEHIVPNLPSVPVQTIISSSENEYGLFDHIRRYPWVLEPYRYDNLEMLMASLTEKVILPPEEYLEHPYH